MGLKLVVDDCVDEELMDAAVSGEFGMEGGGEDAALADEDGEAIAAGKDFDIGTGFNDAWGADEDHLERLGTELRWDGEDRRIDLAAVGIALYDGIKEAEANLRGMAYFA